MSANHKNLNMLTSKPLTYKFLKEHGSPPKLNNTKGGYRFRRKCHKLLNVGRKYSWVANEYNYLEMRVC
jgi:hypothetical protein